MKLEIDGLFKELATVIKAIDLPGVFIDEIQARDLKHFTLTLTSYYKGIDELWNEIVEYSNFEGIGVPILTIGRKE